MHMRYALPVLACLLIGIGPAAAQDVSGNGLSGGMGGLGAAVQAGNRDCPPRGASDRRISIPSATGAITCAPTGAGPGTGAPPSPQALAHPLNKTSPNTRETPGHAGQ